MPSDTRRICGPADETRAPFDENKIKEEREKHVSECSVLDNTDRSASMVPCHLLLL